MAGRLVFELFIFSIPFLVFGLYVLVTTNAEVEGRRKWPIQILFLIGLGLATAVWFLLILLEKKERDVCHEPARFENGVIIPARDYPCEQNVRDVGVPLKRDPSCRRALMAHPIRMILQRSRRAIRKPLNPTAPMTPIDPISPSWLSGEGTQAVMAALDAARPGGSRFVGGCVRNVFRGTKRKAFAPCRPASITARSRPSIRAAHSRSRRCAAMSRRTGAGLWSRSLRTGRRTPRAAISA